MRAKYRHALPQLGDALFLTDGGLETTMIFLEGIELPHFAAFDLMRTAEGRAALKRYFAHYVAIARRDGRGLVLESATWRSNPDWGAKLGYSAGGAGRGQRRGDRLHPGDPRRRGDGGEPDGAERLHRAARRRLCAGQLHERGGGGGLPRAAGAGLRGGGGRSRDGDDHDLCRGGDRRRAGGEGGGDAGGGLVHGGDRRAACARAWGSARRSRPATRRRAGIRPTTW